MSNIHAALCKSVLRESTSYGLQVPEAHNLKIQPAHLQLSEAVSACVTTSRAWTTMSVALPAGRLAEKADAFHAFNYSLFFY